MTARKRTTKAKPPETQAQPVEPGPPTVPIAPMQLSTQTENFLALTVRRLRELLADAQKRRADGRLTVDIHMASGVLTGAFSISPKWTERLTRS